MINRGKNNIKIMDLEEYKQDKVKNRDIEISKLKTVLEKINNRILYLKNSIPYKDVGKYSVGNDAVERENLWYQKIDQKESNKSIDSLNLIKEDPYFARMDFVVKSDVDGIELDKAYIGKTGLTINNEHIIYDWRSAVGEKYYIKYQNKFNVNEYAYELLLRRSILIKNSMISNVYDEYFDVKLLVSLRAASIVEREINESDIKEAAPKNLIDDKITDPFLLQILEDKKSEYQLTDIIKTIQQNQNKIIRSDIKSSFVVQGCAGSGKTMILLHRLSFLKYNYPSFNLNTVKIITPNLFLNFDFNNLAKKLEIDKIEKFSIEEYYYELICKYNKELSVNINKIIPEYDVDQDVLKFIYSDKYLNMYNSYYERWFRDITDELVEIKNIILNYEISYPEKLEFNKNFLDVYKSIIYQVIKKANEYDKKYNEESHIYNIQLEIAERKKDVIKEINNNLNEIITRKQLICKTLEQEKQRYISDKKKSQGGIIARILNIRTSIDYSKEIKIYDNEIKENKSFISNLTNNLLDEDKFYTINEIEKVIFEFSLISDKFKQAITKIKELEEKVINKNEITTKSINRLRGLLLSDTETKKVDSIKKYLDNINLLKVFESIFSEVVTNEFKKIGSFLNKETRAKMFAKLIYCYSLYGKVVLPDKLLCIDEGQDLAISEYDIIKKINEGVVFNLYGDTNQLIKDNRGVSKWDPIAKLINAKVYELNENYRNSTEITQYCNRIIGINVIPIGVSRGGIIEKPLLDFVETYNLENEEVRTAIIAKDKLHIDVVIQKLDDKSGVTIGKVTKGKLSILTVEEAKGLEFDIVFVIQKNMSRNEKYISFTRALSQLFVIDEL
jgi:DNA helicase IV